MNYCVRCWKRHHKMKMCAVEFVFVKFRSKNNNNYFVRSFRLLNKFKHWKCLKIKCWIWLLMLLLLLSLFSRNSVRNLVAIASRLSLRCCRRCQFNFSARCCHYLIEKCVSVNKFVISYFDLWFRIIIR